MSNSIACVSLLVPDYDEAIHYYRDTLGFELREDTVVSERQRWVVVAPPGSGCGLVLARAKNEVERAAIGRQAGGRVFLFLHTDHFQRDYDAFRGRGVSFLEAPRSEAYGRIAVFEDRYGNRWDLIEPSGGFGR